MVSHTVMALIRMLCIHERKCTWGHTHYHSKRFWSCKVNCFNSLAFRESSPYLTKLSSPVTASLNFLVNLLTGKWSDDYRHSWCEGVQVYFMVMPTLCSRTRSPTEKPLTIMGLIACTKALCIWAHRVHPKTVDIHLKTNDLEKWHLIVYFIVCKHARIVLCFTI